MLKGELKKKSHGMRIRSKNRWLWVLPSAYSRVRHPNITGRVFWVIPKGIPEYHNSQNIMKPEYRLSYNLSWDLVDHTVMYAPRSLWRVLHYEEDKIQMLN